MTLWLVRWVSFFFGWEGEVFRISKILLFWKWVKFTHKLANVTKSDRNLNYLHEVTFFAIRRRWVWATSLTWYRVSCGWHGQPRPGDSTSLVPHSPLKSRRVFTIRPAVEVDRVVRVSIMTYFHCRSRILIPVQTANQMATLYYAQVFILSQIQIPIPTAQYRDQNILCV